jgi:hypothetical protein
LVDSRRGTNVEKAYYVGKGRVTVTPTTRNGDAYGRIKGVTPAQALAHLSKLSDVPWTLIRLLLVVDVLRSTQRRDPCTARVCEALGRGARDSQTAQKLALLRGAKFLTVTSRSRQGGQRWAVNPEAFKEDDVDELEKAAKAAAKVNRKGLLMTNRIGMQAAAKRWARVEPSTESKEELDALTPELIVGLALEGYELVNDRTCRHPIDMGLTVSFAGDVLARERAMDAELGTDDGVRRMVALLRDVWRPEVFKGPITTISKLFERWEDASGWYERWADGKSPPNETSTSPNRQPKSLPAGRPATKAARQGRSARSASPRPSSCTRSSRNNAPRRWRRHADPCWLARAPWSLRCRTVRTSRS